MLIRYQLGPGWREIEHELVGMEARALETRPILELIGKAMQRIEAALFAEGGRGQWPPLSAATIAAKGHDRLLVDSGRLLESLTEDTGESVNEIVGDDTLIFGTRVTSDDGTYYPGLLKEGTSRMPPRDPVPMVSETDLLEFSRAVQTYIVGQDRAAFGTQPWSLGSLDPFGL